MLKSLILITLNLHISRRLQAQANIEIAFIAFYSEFITKTLYFIFLFSSKIDQMFPIHKIGFLIFLQVELYLIYMFRILSSSGFQYKLYFRMNF